MIKIKKIIKTIGFTNVYFTVSDIENYDIDIGTILINKEEYENIENEKFNLSFLKIEEIEIKKDNITFKAKELTNKLKKISILKNLELHKLTNSSLIKYVEGNYM